MAYSSTQLRQTNTLAPTFVTATARRPFTIHSDDPLEFRTLRANHLAALRHLMPLAGQPIPEVLEKDIKVPMRDGSEIRVRVYTPAKAPEASGGGPLILMFHEGGFMYGDLTDEEMNCRLFTREFGAVCLNVEYRLAPEHKFPTWANDAWDTAKWAAANAASLGADPLSKGFLVGGSSAGGNLSAVLAQLSRTEGLQPPITGQYLSVPLIFPLQAVPKEYKDRLLSPFENLHDPVLKGMGAERLQGHVDRLGVDQSSPLYTPLAAAPSTNKLAPAYFQVAGLDPLRDHALIYADIMERQYGSEAKIDLYGGFGHMFWTNWPEMEESQQFVRDTLMGVGWLLKETGLHVQR